MRYYLIGPKPPPIGGVSVHVSRRARQLAREGKNVRILDVNNASAATRAIRIAELMLYPGRADFEVHTYDFTVFAVLLARFFPKRVSYTDHNTRLYGRTLDALRDGIFRRFLREADEVVFVSESVRSSFTNAGIELPQNVAIRSAFLPPPVEDEARIWETYDESTRAFVARHSPLIVANGSEILFYDGLDLYGLDMCVDLAVRLARQFPSSGFLFALANANTNAPYIAEQLERVRSLGVGDQFHLMTGQRELWPLLKRASALIRPTTSDGYSVSLEEALHFGTAVVASDVCDRPSRTVLFPARNVDAAFDALQRCLA